MMRGVVQSGMHSGGTGATVLPLSQARVTLFDVSSGWPAVAGEAKTDRSGSFTIDAPPTEGLFYATANLGNGIVLMTLIGPSLPPAIAINELTTVAAVHCAAAFVERRKLQGDPAGLRAAMERSATLVDAATDTMRSLANVLASSVRDPKAARDTLFDLATPPAGRRPSDTISALHNIVRHPEHEVSAIFEQSRVVAVYAPALERAPESWAIEA